MFRLGLPTSSMKAVVCKETPWQAPVAEAFARAGVSEVAGRSVEEIMAAGSITARKALIEAGIESIDGFTRTALMTIDTRDRIIEILRGEGITQVNGKPVEEFVVHANRHVDLVDIAHDAPPRSLQAV